MQRLTRGIGDVKVAKYAVDRIPEFCIFTILTWIHNKHDALAIEAYAARARVRVRHCETYDEMCDFVRQADVERLVFDVALWSNRSSTALERIMVDRRDPVPIFVIHDCTKPSLACLHFLANLRIQLLPVFRAYHKLENALEMSRMDCLPSASCDMTRRIVPDLNSDLRAVFMSCVVLAERETNAVSVATSLGISVKQLRYRLKSAGLPEFRTFVGALRLVHAVYRMSVFNATSSQAAHLAGFSNVRIFETFTRRHCGYSPNQVLKKMGYTGTLGMLGADQILSEFEMKS